MNDLYKLSISDAERASKVLAGSFQNYPNFAYLFPDPDVRNKNIDKVIKFLVKCGLFHGEVLAPSKNLEGVSIWYKSDELNLSLPGALRAGLINLIFTMDKTSFDKLRKIGNAKRDHRDEIIKGKYYYLDMIGVEPARRNKDHAGMMMRKKLNDADREHISCYLEQAARII